MMAVIMIMLCYINWNELKLKICAKPKVWNHLLWQPLIGSKGVSESTDSNMCWFVDFVFLLTKQWEVFTLGPQYCSSTTIKIDAGGKFQYLKTGMILILRVQAEKKWHLLIHLSATKWISQLNQRHEKTTTSYLYMQMTDKFFLFSLSIFTSFNSMAVSAFTLCICVCRGDCLMGTTANAFRISADIFCQLNAVVRLQMCVFDFKIKVKSRGWVRWNYWLLIW